MPKYLKITISGPFVGTERVEHVEVPDDFDPNGPEAKAMEEAAVWEYVDSSVELVESDDHPDEW